MSEVNIGILWSVSGIALVAASTLYWIGGTFNKLWRRLGSAIILFVTVMGISSYLGSYSHYLWIMLPCLIGGFFMGYGGDGKVLKRTLYALGVCGAGVVYCAVEGGRTWLILPLHIGVGVWSVWLGTKSIVHAKAEEGAICLLLNAGLILYPFVR